MLEGCHMGKCTKHKRVLKRIWEVHEKCHRGLGSLHGGVHFWGIQQGRLQVAIT